MGELTMKKLLRTLSKTMAALTLFSALRGAGLASQWGWYQPKVPIRLTK
jgi:cyclic lactone autoinducer peptide